MQIKNLLGRVYGLLNPPPPKTMEDILQEYRDIGIKIGNNCHIYSTLSRHKDCFLLEIGNDVTISTNVTFLMHDNAICKPMHDTYTDVLGGVKIKDNCFIGDGSIILPGVTVENNCIIGAGSVVTKSTEPNGVYAGNPAKYISKVEDYLERSRPYMVNIEGYTREQVQALVGEHPEKLRKR